LVVLLHVSTGGVTSVTTTVNEHVDVFAGVALSVAVQVTVVVPRLNSTPLMFVPVPVVAPVKAYVNEFTRQLSVAVAFHPAGAAYLQFAAAVTFCAPVTPQVMLGGVLSTTVIV
jgi:hypothetical protein